MKKFLIYQPTSFFVGSLLIGLFAYGMAAYASYCITLQSWLFPLVFMGMASPTISAFILFFRGENKIMWTDFFQRMSPFKIRLSFIPLIFFSCLV